MINQLDTRILAVVRIIAHALQRTFGVSVFVLAQLPVVVVMTMLTLQACAYFLPHIPLPVARVGRIETYVLYPPCMLFFLLQFTWLTHAEQRFRAQSRALDESVFWLRTASPLGARVFMWGILLMLAYTARKYALVRDCLFTCYLYLVHVDPLPPGESKVRALLCGFRALAQRAPATSTLLLLLPIEALDSFQDLSVTRVTNQLKLL